MDVTDSEIREVAFSQFKKERMERYVPISYIAEMALIFSYSRDPPTEFILSLEPCIRSHLNLVEDRIWSLLEPVLDSLSKSCFYGLRFSNFEEEKQQVLTDKKVDTVILEIDDEE